MCVHVSRNVTQVARNNGIESLEFLTPEGVGVGYPIAVFVGEELSNLVYFSYSPPILNRLTVEQDGVSASNSTTLHLSGLNFGGTQQRAGVEVWVG